MKQMTPFLVPNSSMYMDFEFTTD